MKILSTLVVSTTLLFTAMMSSAQANNLDISSFDVVSIDSSANTMTFTFDITQDNSWRSSTNHDAVWLFMKYSTDAGQTWKHASMAGNGINPEGFSIDSDYEIVVPQDENGFFVRRVDFGSGTLAIDGVTFVWDYGQDGLTDSQAAAANTINNLYGIEVVYIPEGGFYAGDGAGATGYRFGKTEPWYIGSENAVKTTSTEAAGYYYQNTGAAGTESASGDVFLLPNSFPKGFKAFYLMKYELTEGQWVAFFNTLTTNQRPYRDITSSNEGGKNSDGVVFRNTVAWDSTTPTLPATTNRLSRAATYLSWPDVAAFADWAALRPITELEFEKATRGADILFQANEYPWGTTSYSSPTAADIFPPTADEDGTETVDTDSFNVNAQPLAWTTGDGRVGGEAASQKGPLRVGIFAEGSTSRAYSGAGYYGNMDLAGNLAEPVVTVGRIEGRQFLGTHGDGNLTTLGFATNVDWPGIDSSSNLGVTGTIGIGYRGGDFQSSSADFQMSSRGYAAKDPDSESWNQRYDASAGIFYGGRLGRTAP